MEYRKKGKGMGLLRFIVVLPLLAAAMFWIWGKYERHGYELYHKNARDKVLHDLIGSRDRLEFSLNSHLFIPLSIESFVVSRGSMNSDEFTAFAERLWSHAGDGLMSIQVAVGTEVRYVYPLQGNESVVGLDLLSIDGQAETVRRTIEGGSMVVAGPYNLIQGGEGLIVRQPIYRSQAKGGAYWGLATIIIDWQQFLRDSGVADVRGLDFVLQGQDGSGAAGRVFFGDKQVLERDPVSLSISLPEGEWLVSATPSGGWATRDSHLQVERSVFFAMMLLVLLVATLAMAYPRLLQRRIDQATRELADNHALLEQRVAKRTIALQESEAQMRRLFDSLPFPVVVTAVGSGAYLYANDGAAELFEENKEQRGQVAGDYYQNPADREKLLAGLRHDGMLSNLEVELKSGKGNPFWALLSAVTLDFDGHDAILLSITDISERRAIEQAHIASEKNLRTIFDSVPTPMAITRNSDGKLVRINKAGLMLSGLGVGSMEEFRAEDFYCDTRDREKIMHLLELEGSVQDLEICMRSLSGERFTFLMSAIFIDYEDEPCLLSSYAEITERKKFEQSLERANREALQAIQAKNEFLATMSHEIRTPLNGALSMVKLLGRTQLDAQQRDYLNAIDFSGESLLQILSDVLDLSKLEAGKLELEQFNFDLRNMVDEMVGLMQVQCDPQRVSLTATLDSRIPSQLCGDAIRLRQVLFNLLGNALKFTERGEVELQANFISERRGKIGIEFSVRDTGIGIAEEVQPRLFGDFTQADSSMARRFGGSGLGLAICKRMVGLMGGEIGVESEPGKGSRFWFRLDMQRGSAPQDSPNGEVEVILPSDALRVLLVEDDAINRFAGSELLRQQGCEVTIAADGYEALERFHDGYFDVVLMDVRMPGMDGLETTQRLREIEPHGATVPVIALTADVTQENIDRCRAVGMQEVLSKPIHMDRLSRALAAVRVHDGADDSQMVNGEEKPSSGPG
ncbi:MAG: ATP-binding protein [Pseudomonadota bacterium]